MKNAQQVTGYVKGVAQELKLLPISTRSAMRWDAALAFLRMQGAAQKAGVSLVVNSGFRTMEEQRVLHQKYLSGTGNLAATPGYSNHQGGIAVDIATGGTSTPIYTWLVTNAARYGFKRTVESEPWHWEYRPAEVKP